MKKEHLIQIIAKSKTPEEAANNILAEAASKPLEGISCEYPCTNCPRCEGCMKTTDCKRWINWFKARWNEVTKELRRK